MNSRLLKLGVAGYRGRFGSAIVRQAERAGAVVCWRRSSQEQSESDAPSVLVDVSSPLGVASSLAFCRARGLPLLVGASGLSQELKDELSAAGAEIPVCRVANFSMLHYLQRAILELLAGACTTVAVAPRVSVVERHPVFKRDKPSASAVALAECWRKDQGVLPEITSVRDGKEVSDHRVDLDFDGERLSILHAVEHREGPARCAVRMAALLQSKPAAAYDAGSLMAELLGLSTLPVVAAGSACAGSGAGARPRAPESELLSV